VKYLIECGAHINAGSQNNPHVLFSATANGHIEVAKYLLEHMIDKKITDRLLSLIVIRILHCT